MKTVIVEGWRYLAHSYAVVNQFQCLEMLKRPDLKVYHRDVPYFSSRWLVTPGILPEEYEAKLRGMEPPPPGLKADAMLRIGFPHYFHLSPEAERTFVWVTSEFKLVQDVAIGIGKKAWQVLPDTQATIIACSGWAAQGFINCGAPKSKMVVVPCGVDTELFHPVSPEERAAIRKQLGWEGRFVALNVSSATSNKGLDLMLKTMVRLAPKHESLLLSLKGSDDLYKSAQYAQAQTHQLSRADREVIRLRLAYQGATVSAVDMCRLYCAADVYFSPYRAEGFNLPVLEAAACGLPVICTRGGSTDDFVDDSWCLRVDGKETTVEKLGTLIEPDFEQLVSTLDRAVRDDDWRRAAAEAGPKWVREKFTWKHTVDQLLKVMLPE